MYDRNERIFFKSKFSVQMCTKGDLLWEILKQIRKWQEKKCEKRQVQLPSVREWSRWKYGGEMLSSDGSVRFQSEYFAPQERETISWACRIVERIPQEGYADRDWITELGVEQQEEDTAQLSIAIFYRDRAGFIGPYQERPKASVPNLVRSIAAERSLNAFCGGDVLVEVPQKLQVGDGMRFLQQIRDPGRRLPYVLISPRVTNAQTGATEHLIDPAALARSLFSNAAVFYADDPDFSSELRALAVEYSCYGGAIRVYQPGVSETFRHRYLSAEELERYGAEQVKTFLIQAFVQNVQVFDSLFGMEQCRERKRAYRHEKEKEQQLRKAEKDQHEIFEIAGEEEKKRRLAEEEAEVWQKLADEAQQETERKDVELDSAKEKIYNLERQLNAMRSAADENDALRSALDARFQMQTLPNTPENVAQYFGQVFADRIAFTKEADRSLKKCTLAPGELWRVFFALATEMWDLYRNRQGSGDIFQTFREKTGIDAKRGEGYMTRKDPNLMKQFRQEFLGEQIDIEPHITYAAQKQSIHFGYSEKLGKLVIGHCGEHLKNFSTKNVK